MKFGLSKPYQRSPFAKTAKISDKKFLRKNEETDGAIDAFNEAPLKSWWTNVEEIFKNNNKLRDKDFQSLDQQQATSNQYDYEINFPYETKKIQEFKDSETLSSLKTQSLTSNSNQFKSNSRQATIKSGILQTALPFKSNSKSIVDGRRPWPKFNFTGKIFKDKATSAPNIINAIVQQPITVQPFDIPALPIEDSDCSSSNPNNANCPPTDTLINFPPFSDGPNLNTVEFNANDNKFNPGNPNNLNKQVTSFVNNFNSNNFLNNLDNFDSFKDNKEKIFEQKHTEEKSRDTIALKPIANENLLDISSYSSLVNSENLGTLGINSVNINLPNVVKSDVFTNETSNPTSQILAEDTKEISGKRVEENNGEKYSSVAKDNAIKSNSTIINSASEEAYSLEGNEVNNDVSASGQSNVRGNFVFHKTDFKPGKNHAKKDFGEVSYNFNDSHGNDEEEYYYYDDDDYYEDDYEYEDSPEISSNNNRIANNQVNSIPKNNLNAPPFSDIHSNPDIFQVSRSNKNMNNKKLRNGFQNEEKSSDLGSHNNNKKIMFSFQNQNLKSKFSMPLKTNFQKKDKSVHSTYTDNYFPGGNPEMYGKAPQTTTTQRVRTTTKRPRRPVPTTRKPRPKPTTKKSKRKKTKKPQRQFVYFNFIPHHHHPIPHHHHPIPHHHHPIPHPSIRPHGLPTPVPHLHRPPLLTPRPPIPVPILPTPTIVGNIPYGLYRNHLNPYAYRPRGFYLPYLSSVSQQLRNRYGLGQQQQLLNMLTTTHFDEE